MVKSLNSYRKNIFSQFGEDGIIEQIFKIIPVGTDPLCVEFGAWDGVHLSNTHNLVKNKDWGGVFIEPNKGRFKDLLKNYENFPKAICINKFVMFSGKNSLDNILGSAKVKKDFNLLSIDIDGNDYHIWNSIKKYLPKVVVIEFNPSIAHDIEFVQEKDFKVNQGHSLLSLVKLGKSKGYELIATTDINAFFVKKKYFSLFKTKDNHHSKLHDNTKYLTHFYQLYDGTIVTMGCNRLIWHGIFFKKNDFQILPQILRKFPNKYNAIMTKIYKLDFKGLSNLWKYYKSTR